MTHLRDSRRRWLAQTGALVSSTILPPWAPFARAQPASTLNALPRIALIIGNSKYRESPLRNPGNDAKGIADALRRTGFQVELKLDAGRGEMIEAIRAFSGQIAKQRPVGLFYYAGHGAQLAWRNYLVPVDAEIEKLEDMQTQAVELGTLLEGLNKARNPMNVIILDACRDNPFGNRVLSQQKGLSQFDAPPGSLLAYATSPGNTAADGDGANGLYTESLLREITVPEAKIEDVLKRVRLNVRRKSNGQQIPWESTSLEDDFYFLPPQQLKKLSEAELGKRFSEELAIWEKIKTAKDPAPFEDYLRKYPSGQFSEIAQFQLDRALAAQGEKKIETVSVPENPFSKGVARADTRYKIGDSYSFRDIDLYTKLDLRTYTFKVTAITDTEVHINDGLAILDLLGNPIKLENGLRFTPCQFQPAEYSVGKKWTTRFRSSAPNGSSSEVVLDCRITQREKITVPAGTFDAYKVDQEGWVLQAGVNLKNIFWFAPEVRFAIVRERINKHQSGKVLLAERRELTAFSQ